jgi:uncharacterized protein
MKRSGYADLPLHRGHVPSWLATRMTMLGTAIVEAVLYEYGRSEVLTRLSDPFWFQALGRGAGHGLALLRHYDRRHGRAEARPESPCA